MYVFYLLRIKNCIQTCFFLAWLCLLVEGLQLTTFFWNTNNYIQIYKEQNIFIIHNVISLEINVKNAYLWLISVARTDSMFVVVNNCCLKELNNILNVAHKYLSFSAATVICSLSCHAWINIGQSIVCRSKSLTKRLETSCLPNHTFDPSLATAKWYQQ